MPTSLYAAILATFIGITVRQLFSINSYAMKVKGAAYTSEFELPEEKVSIRIIESYDRPYRFLKNYFNAIPRIYSFYVNGLIINAGVALVALVVYCIPVSCIPGDGRLSLQLVALAVALFWLVICTLYYKEYSDRIENILMVMPNVDIP